MPLRGGSVSAVCRGVHLYRRHRPGLGAAKPLRVDCVAFSTPNVVARQASQLFSRFFDRHWWMRALWSAAGPAAWVAAGTSLGVGTVRWTLVSPSYFRVKKETATGRWHHVAVGNLV